MKMKIENGTLYVDVEDKSFSDVILCKYNARGKRTPLKRYIIKGTSKKGGKKEDGLVRVHSHSVAS